MQNTLVGLVLLLMAAACLAAPQDVAAHGYTLHYNALPSATLSEEMARQHGILRSRGTGVLIVSVQAESEEGSVPAHVEAQAIDGHSQPVDISWRTVRVGEYISYLGTFRVRDGESIRFSLSATPRGSDVTLSEYFRQSFAAD